MDVHETKCEHRPFHREGDGITPCSNCPRTFSDPSSCSRHVREQHGTQYYKCPKESCGRWYAVTVSNVLPLTINASRSIKRRSGFKNHLAEHDFAPEDLTDDRLLAYLVNKPPTSAPPGEAVPEPPTKRRPRTKRHRRVKGGGRVNGRDHIERGGDFAPAIAGPSMYAGLDAPLSNGGDFVSAAPPYSSTPRFGGEPLRCYRSAHVLTPFIRRDTAASRPS